MIRTPTFLALALLLGCDSVTTRENSLAARTAGERCADAWDLAYDACLEAGGSAITCAPRADAAEDACVGDATDRGDDRGDGDDACTLDCRERAAEALDDCVAEGGGEEACQERAEAYFDRCEAGCERERDTDSGEDDGSEDDGGRSRG